MKIAVTYENGEIFQHFGHSEQFKVYEVEDGTVVSSEVIGSDGQGHGALAGLLAAVAAAVIMHRPLRALMLARPSAHIIAAPSMMAHSLILHTTEASHWSLSAEQA